MRSTYLPLSIKNLSLYAYALVVATALLSLSMAAQAQLARKPSSYAQQNPAQSSDLIPKELSQNTLPPRRSVTLSLPALLNQTEFDSLARTYDAGTPAQLSHVLFVVDMQAKPARTYYVNTPRYQLHTRFVRETGLAPKAGKKAIDQNYLLPSRRFLFGTLSWQTNIRTFTYEFWEGDQLTAALVRQADASVKASFFAPVKFKTNSNLHERRAQEAAVGFVTQEELVRELPFIALNLGATKGRLRVLDNISQVNSLQNDDIAVLRQVPISLPPVAGVLTERPSTALSHVNLLTKGWGVPNAYVRDAATVLRKYEGQWVELIISSNNYQVRPLGAEEIATYIPRSKRAIAIANTALSTKPDLREKQLLPLAALRAKNSAQCGSKAANLGAMFAARIPDTTVPDGFCIPFSHYHQFMQQHGLAAKLVQLQQQTSFANDPLARKQALAQLQSDIMQWPVDPILSNAWRARWQSQLGGTGVFVRSSSNSEDLPGFSGAGLYTTVPNVKTADALEMAVKKVWASVFNPEAWEARSAAGFSADAVLMGVFVQTAIDSTNSGVMITRDPYDASHNYITYISAKRGIGIRVVEGQRIAEQVMYSSWSKAIQVISRSADDVALQLDNAGGVKEVPVELGRSVLNDALVLRLANVGAAVKRVFRSVDQDIEWATSGERIVLLQARPYIERSGK